MNTHSDIAVFATDQELKAEAWIRCLVYFQDNEFLQALDEIKRGLEFAPYLKAWNRPLRDFDPLYKGGKTVREFVETWE